MNKEKRLKELLQETRISFNPDGDNPEGNRVRGLYDLVLDWLGPDFVVVEIGSCEGSSTELFALTCKYVYAIDPWDNLKKPHNERVIKNAVQSEKIYKARMSKYDNVKTIKGFSVAESLLFEDGSVDAVYIDGAHDPLSVRKDLNAWLPKIRVGGVMCGHDYPCADVRNEVIEILGNTAQTYKDGSWALRIHGNSW